MEAVPFNRVPPSIAIPNAIFVKRKNICGAVGPAYSRTISLAFC
jgi:hypothetical protein